MATIKDRSFRASQTSLDLTILEIDSESSTINIKFNCGNNHLEYKFVVLRSDLTTLPALILNHWDDLLEGGVWDATEPSFSVSISALEGDIVDELDELIYRFQFWIDAGEYNLHRSTRSGIGITIYQNKKAIEDFVLQLKKEISSN